jgi:glycolate oxidase FAD binding subunit
MADDGALRPAGDDDVICGVPARFVAAPATTSEAAAVVREAAARQLSIVVRGTGTKQDWGHPPRQVDLLLDTRRLTGVVEHAAGDLITVVRAGTPLDQLQTQLGSAGQELAIDSPYPGGTVGGAVAVNTSGPRRMAYGTLRDLIIGSTLVLADGTVAHAGGKVVKNVAGYDLSKLLTGSYGTLGLIAECAFRLHPRPAATAVLRRAIAGPTELATLVSAVLGAQLAPGALEVDAPADGDMQLAIALSGVPEGVSQRAATAGQLLGDDVIQGEPDWWGAYPWRAGDCGVKLTSALSQLPVLLAAALTARERHGVALAVRGSAGSGILYAGLPGQTDPAVAARVVDDLRTAATEAGGHAVVLTAPAAIRDRVDLWGPVPGLGVMRRVKAQFDPAGRFAAGRFAGGI